MSSRLAPHTLAPEVRAALQAELSELNANRRPRGDSGRRHDRLSTYLREMLEHTTDATQPSPVAEAGMRTALRFTGDVEHRSVHLHDPERGAPPEGSHPVLPTDWALGDAVGGATAGDTITYEDPAGRERTVVVLAVWDPRQEATWELAGLDHANH
jgi:transcription elongation GreA/GreB family factor